MVAVASLLIFLVLWEVLVIALKVRPIMVPAPTAILRELSDAC